jgi:hypothetical protein
MTPPPHPNIARQKVRSLLALLLQKYKYCVHMDTARHLPEGAQPLLYPLSLLALLVQKYKY